MLSSAPQVLVSEFRVLNRQPTLEIPRSRRDAQLQSSRQTENNLTWHCKWIGFGLSLR